MGAGDLGLANGLAPANAPNPNVEPLTMGFAGAEVEDEGAAAAKALADDGWNI